MNLDSVPYYVPLLVFIIATLAMLWSRVSLRSSSLHRVWTEVARHTGCSFSIDSGQSLEQVAGKFRGRELLLTTDLDCVTTRMFVTCSNATDYFLSIVSSGCLWPTEQYRITYEGSDEPFSNAHPVRSLTGVEEMESIDVGDARFNESFRLKSNGDSKTAERIVQVLRRSMDQRTALIEKDLTSLFVEHNEVRVVLGKLYCRQHHITALPIWFTAMSEIADIVEKLPETRTCRQEI